VTDTSLIKQLAPHAPHPTLEQIEKAKAELHERYDREDLERLKGVADLLRRPMNRKQRRALQSRLRRAA